jgi:hypothetical protein
MLAELPRCVREQKEKADMEQKKKQSFIDSQESGDIVGARPVDINEGRTN